MHKLLPLLIILIALPLFVWVLLNSNFDLRRFASGDPAPVSGDPNPSPYVSNQPAPVSPSPTPSPVVSVAPQPSITTYPAPSIKASPRSTILPNPSNIALPTSLNISTGSLPLAYVGRNYNGSISGYSINTNANLTFNAAGLPTGLNLTNCNSAISGGKKTINCSITGKPTKTGIYPVNLILLDNLKNKSTKTVNLFIIKLPFGL